MLRRQILVYCSLSLAWPAVRAKADTEIVVSVPDQKLAVVQNGQRVAEFPVSTSKFGLGDRPRSFATPLGELQVTSKVGENATPGTVFRSLRPTGEIISANAPGRDPIVTRIMCLRGLQAQNAHAAGRGIYIHGTPQERLIGRPASYGCIRMRSRDVVKVFEETPIGTKVEILNEPVSRAIREMASMRGTETTGETSGRG
jgi:lipoprotein-anchoring transpeptidase ErfK/SrfK